MEPLDLSVGPPRSPRATLEGVVFLPRSIDKIRASLPGGKLGPYTISGGTTELFERLEIPLERITEAVAAAASEAEVGSFVRQSTTPEKIAAWNAYVEQREPRNGNRVAALESYPWLNETPDLRYVLDVLAEDDRRTFASR